MIASSLLWPTIAAFLLTLVAHVSARLISKRITALPTVITALGLVIIFLYLLTALGLQRLLPGS